MPSVLTAVVDNAIVLCVLLTAAINKEGGYSKNPPYSSIPPPMPRVATRGPFPAEMQVSNKDKGELLEYSL